MLAALIGVGDLRVAPAAVGHGLHAQASGSRTLRTDCIDRARRRRVRRVSGAWHWLLLRDLAGRSAWLWIPGSQSATAKIANLVTNLSAIVVFGLSGSVLWALGLMMGAANLVGGFLGARTAIARGSTFVRKVFLVVLTGLIIKLAYDLVAQLVQ